MKILMPLALAALTMTVSLAKAEERESIQLVSGDWALLVHQPSEVAPPDICVASSEAGHFAFRADAQSTTVRVDDESWSLPADVTGTVTIEVSGFAFPMSIDYNTESMVDAVIPPRSLNQLLDDASSSSVMKVTAGKSSWTVSLNGSQKVINAFRTCAHLGGSAPGGGGNPFQ